MAIADIIPADVFAFASELKPPVLSDQFWVDTLAYVNQFNLTSLDSDIDRRMARIFLAAHIGSMDKRAGLGAAGPLTGESVGGIRRSYGVLMNYTSNSSLGSTRYGQCFLDILGMSLVGLPMVI